MPSTAAGDRHPLITVDPTSAVPPYEQVRAGVLARVRAGELPPGSRLPTVRALADELSLAANTVARAYRELEAAGVIETHGRRGTLVAAGDVRQQQAVRAAASFAETMHRLGVPAAEAIALARAAFGTRAMQ